MINLYNTLILPHISYCTIVWGHCSQTLKNTLFVLQKRALRIITNSHPRTPSKALFMKYNILPIHDIYKLQIASFMYLFFSHKLPPVFDNLFSLNSSYHNYNTRNRMSVHIPLFKFKISRQSLNLYGPKLWHSIPPNIRNSPSLTSFKKNYKIFLINSWNISQ